MQASNLTKTIGILGISAFLAFIVGTFIATGYVAPLPPVGPNPGLGVRVSEYDHQGLVLVALGLGFLFAAILIPRMARSDNDSRFLFRILLLGFVLKMMAAFARLWMNIDVYGFRDAGRYHTTGMFIADSIRSLEFGRITQFFEFGTFFTMFYTGVVYTVTGPTVFGGFLAFGALSFLGSFFFYKAFRVAFPEGRNRLFAILIFLSPSVLYWPNGIGKDALMFLFIGLAAYGAVLLLVRSRLIGLVPLILGSAGVYTIREPVAWIIVISLVAAFFLGKVTSDRTIAKVSRPLILGVGLLFIWLALPSILNELKLERLALDSSTFEGIDRYFEAKHEQAGGDSRFDSVSSSHPMFVPIAVVTALFRPFLWETHNLQIFIQAVDGTILLGVMLWRAPAVARALVNFRSSPYVVLIVVYVLLMSVALATEQNFGTLARQRSMLLPFALMLVAFEPPPKKVPAQSEEKPVPLRGRLATQR